MALISLGLRAAQPVDRQLATSPVAGDVARAAMRKKRNRGWRLVIIHLPHEDESRRPRACFLTLAVERPERDLVFRPSWSALEESNLLPVYDRAVERARIWTLTALPAASGLAAESDPVQRLVVADEQRAGDLPDD